ncbi:hypothetical protein DBV15_02642 [Temnothorax longispinosus]|uniref:Uncharacterized protein n=1 Tax=Temnothorax longispinosus TaxID=300112 RepID=A0A4S2K939_9HYME|nr:hypothetical protein DBV15_02642 [Temnothorax longispinosus]
MLNTRDTLYILRPYLRRRVVHEACLARSSSCATFAIRAPCPVASLWFALVIQLVSSTNSGKMHVDCAYEGIGRWKNRQSSGLHSRPRNVSNRSTIYDSFVSGINPESEGCYMRQDSEFSLGRRSLLCGWIGLLMCTRYHLPRELSRVRRKGHVFDNTAILRNIFDGLRLMRVKTFAAVVSRGAFGTVGKCTPHSNSDYPGVIQRKSILACCEGVAARRGAAAEFKGRRSGSLSRSVPEKRPAMGSLRVQQDERLSL